MSAKGLKSQLIARLTKALKTEQEVEETAGEEAKDEEEEVSELKQLARSTSHWE